MRIGLCKPLFREGNLNRPYRAQYLGFTSIIAYIQRDTPQHEFVQGPDGAELVAMSCVSETLHLIKKLCRELRARDFAGPIVLGGAHFTALPETMPPQADVCVIGQGEETFAELVAAFEKNRDPDLSQIAGIAYRDSDGVIQRTPGRVLKPLDEYPIDIMAVPQDWMQISTIRGCPYRCEHCVEHANQGKVRWLSAGRLVSVMEDRVKRTGNNHFFFQDDTFLAAKGRLEKIHELMRKKNLFGKFVIEAVSLNANLVTEHTMPMLKDIGVKVCGMGAESWNARVFSQMKCRVVTQAHLLRTIKYAEKADMLPLGGAIVVGFPGETAAELAGSIHGAQTMKREGKFRVWGCYACQPLPGSPLWDRLLTQGKVGINMDFSTLRIDAISEHFDSEWAYWNDGEMSRDEFKRVVKASGFARPDAFN